MMKRQILLLFLVVYLTTAFRIHEKATPALKGGDNVFMVQIKKLENLRSSSSMANSLFTLAELHVAKKNPVQRLLDGIDKLVKELQTAQDAENKRYSDKRAIHDNTVQEFTMKINAATGEIASNKQKIESILKPRKKFAQDKITDLTKIVEQKREEIATLTTTRNTEREQYERTLKEVNDAILAIDQCLEAVNSLLTGTPSLVQYRKASTEIRKMHRQLSQKHLVELPLIEALLEIATSQNFANKESVEQVLKLLNELRSKTSKALQKLNSDEEQSLKEFNERTATLNKELSDAKAQIIENTQVIGDTDKEIKASDNIILTKTNEENSLKELLNNENENWRKETQIHEDIIKEILQEIEIIKQCREMFANKQFSEYVMSKVQ
eukprot:TRINITY_DN176_c0_g1_i1.p1 TRINITY_DN176_c0_g1~~TRINITY_DN176_c0_g1_i1.p1  ORF type:complete len:382 (+),score=108.47 TRINITY_DN176_c0_g1_i1:47-1192(+)